MKLKLNRTSRKLLKVLEDYLASRFQRIVLNGQVTKWAAVNVGVPQGSILSPLMFLIYINDLSNELSSNSTLFADEASIFSVVRDRILSANAFNNDLLRINNWAYQWQMSFNLDPSNQTQKAIFSCKIKKPSHPVLIFNNNQVTKTSYQKHFGLFLSEKINFG